MIRQFDDVNGVPQEFHVYEPVGVSNGDPEGAMEMRKYICMMACLSLQSRYCNAIGPLSF